MAGLSSMRSSLRYWDDRADELNQKIRKLKRRRSDVEAVKSALGRTAGNHAGDVNNKIRSAGRKLDSAIEYASRESQLDGILAGKDERGAGEDGSLACADSELQRELSEVNRQLGEAESGLTQARNKVSGLKSDIAAEERRQREEALRKTGGGMIKVYR